MLVTAKPSRLAALFVIALVAAPGCGDSDSSGADADPPDDARGGATADAAGSGALCGGFAGATCDDGLYCDYGDNHCGGEDGEGTCREAPVGCSGDYRPACGCDGEVYSNPCVAQANGVDLSNDGGCEPPEGTFACGHGFCEGDSQYCQLTASDVSGLPDNYECVEFPEACGSGPSCDCLADEPCGDTCDETDGTFTLTCPGG